MRMTAARAAVVVGALLAGWTAVSAFAGVAAAEQASQPGFSAAGSLDAGVYHTCALSDGGSVRCWGFGAGGVLGYGNTISIGDDETPGTAGPVNLGPGRVTAISAGDFHTCALLDDGSVHCWGFGAEGRLGYGSINNVGDTPDTTPDKAGAVNLGPGQATAISAGGGHTCALLDDGSVRCWGFGGSGELGYGNGDNVGGQPTTTPDTAGPVDLGRPAVAISAGKLHTCALLDDGKVRCWGDNSRGELGQGNTITVGDDETPDSAYTLNAVACPSASQCTAVDDIGRQVTFDPTAPGTPTPTTIDNGQPLRGVACPSASQCTAVDDIGRQVTFDPTAPGTPTPTTINNGSSAVACPSATQCTAVDYSGREVTFNPTAPGTPTPTTIDDSGSGLTAVACPSASQCTAVDYSGREVTFNPTAPGTPTPTTIDDSGSGLTAVACPSASQCTAVGYPQQVTFDPTAPGTPTSTTIDSHEVLHGVACPSTSQCTAVDGSGREMTFNPTAPGAPTPITISPILPVDLGPRRATAIAAGNFHTCALLDDGSVRCWGSGATGKLGYGNTGNVGDTPGDTPDKAGAVNLGGRAVAISAGGGHTCARLEDGDLRCWGDNARGQLGYGNTVDVGDDETPNAVGPVYLGPRRTDLAVTAGGDHTCARLDDGSVRCWGAGAFGRLGYCSENVIGDDELPGAVGPVSLALGDGGAGCQAPPPPGAPPDTGASPPPAGAAAIGPTLPPVDLDAARGRAMRRCLARVATHARHVRRLARRGSARARAKARRRAGRQARRGRRRCARIFGRTPGRVTGLHAQGQDGGLIELTFNAPGTKGRHAPAAHSYAIAQSRRPIRSARAFARAQPLCKGACRFAVTTVGDRVTLIVTGLRPRTTYYYAVAARDNVSDRCGPRTRTVKARTGGASTVAPGPSGGGPTPLRAHRAAPCRAPR